MSLTLFRGWFVIAILALTVSSAHAEKNLERPPGTTRYVPMVAQLRSLLHYDKTQGGGRMSLSSIGRSLKGREIWMVTLRAPAEDAGTETQPTPDAVTPQPKKLFYLCRQHGHEPASTEGALAFIRDLVQAAPDSSLIADLRHVTVYVVPMANPDGAEAFLRHNARNVDLNRDWLRRTQPETQSWYRAIIALHPDMMTDQHELYPDDKRPDFTETAGPGSGATENVIETCAGTQAVVQTFMAAEGFLTVSHTITDGHPARLAHRYGCVVLGIPTILFETNRLVGSGRNVGARGQAHYQFMMTVLRDLAGERQELLTEAAAQRGLRANTLLASRHKTVPRANVDTPAPPPPSGTDVPATQGSE